MYNDMEMLLEIVIIFQNEYRNGKNNRKFTSIKQMEHESNCKKQMKW